MSASFADYERLADDFAQAQAQAEYLDEFKKSKLALLMKDAEKLGHNTAAAQEREARGNPQYLELLDGLKVATEKALKARYMLKQFEMRFEYYRTQEATKRAEMNLR